MVDQRCIPIVCDGKRLFVTENLFDALVQLRSTAAQGGFPTRKPKHKRQKYLFIDQICVDFENPEERTYQVAIMGMIFANAQTVFGWLGKTDEHTSEGLAVVSALSSISPTDYKIAGGLKMEDPSSYHEFGIAPIGKHQWIAFAQFLCVSH